MKNEFKTPIFEKWFNMLLWQYPILQEKEQELKNMLKEIELPDKHPPYEHFYSELHLGDCGDVTVVWNIEKILADKSKITKFETYTVQKLMSLVDFNNHYTKEVMMGLLLKEKVKHRAEFITLAMFPGFPQFVIIDGNHRVLENLANPSFPFKCYTLEGEAILDYLEPNSRKFAEFVFYLEKFVLKHV